MNRPTPEIIELSWTNPHVAAAVRAFEITGDWDSLANHLIVALAQITESMSREIIAATGRRPVIYHLHVDKLSELP